MVALGTFVRCQSANQVSAELEHERTSFSSILTHHCICASNELIEMFLIIVFARARAVC